MILYDYDSNAILAEPMISRTASSIVAAYKTLHSKLVSAGLQPQLQKLDNECSEALKDFMRKQEVDFQLVPPHVHRRNAAERAIRTFQNHFIAALCSVDPLFPLHLWDKLIPQANITLNLLRGSRINPKLSAYSQLFGTFDYNRTPLAPPGSRVLVHEPSTTRTTWSAHSSDGWYIGPALESYRCYKCWMIDTHRDRISDTVTWLPSQFGMPIATTADLIMSAAEDLLTALSSPSAAPLLATMSTSRVTALKQLATILTNDDESAAITPNTTIPTPSTDAPLPRVPTPL
jgi:hypothetical protein